MTLTLMLTLIACGAAVAGMFWLELTTTTTLTERVVLSMAVML